MRPRIGSKDDLSTTLIHECRVKNMIKICLSILSFQLFQLGQSRIFTLPICPAWIYYWPIVCPGSHRCHSLFNTHLCFGGPLGSPLGNLQRLVVLSYTFTYNFIHSLLSSWKWLSPLRSLHKHLLIFMVIHDN